LHTEHCPIKIHAIRGFQSELHYKHSKLVLISPSILSAVNGDDPAMVAEYEVEIFRI
jgi:hypothetical protein